MAGKVISQVRWKPDQSRTHKHTTGLTGTHDTQETYGEVHDCAAAEELRGSKRLVSQLIIQILYQQLLAQQQRNEECVFVAHC